MRYRLLASYQGAPYEAGIGPGESGVVLFAACPPPEDLHFEPATGHWRKSVRRGEVQSLYESRPVGMFRGERCVILDDLTDRLHIAYLGHDAVKAERLGYWEVDRGVFELIAPRQEVTEVIEQRVPVCEAAGQGPPLPEAEQRQPASEHTDSNGHWPGLLPPDPGRRSRAADDEPREKPAGSHSLPLPLEAQAMRAASAAARRDRHDSAERPFVQARPGSDPADLLSPAGLSEPSGLARKDDEPSSVPSWTPNPHVPSQRAAQSETGTSKSASPGEPAESLPGIGYAGHPDTLASNGYYGRAAQALADVPSFDAPSDGSPYDVRAGQGQPAQPAPAQPESGLGESRFSRRRRSARRRMTTQRIFSELAGQAGIPAPAYAIDEDVDGAMCLVQTDEGFEVFNSLAGARHEVRQFTDEESAYFYLFGVLAAEAVRTGTLGVVGPRA